MGHNVKTDIAMPHLTCLGKILTELCQKMTYYWRRMTELCPNDIIALIDAGYAPYNNDNEVYTRGSIFLQRRRVFQTFCRICYISTRKTQWSAPFQP